MPAPTVELDFRAACTLLKNPRRQGVLEYLHAMDEPVEPADIVDHLASSSDQPASELYIRLIHVDLPKLAQTGVVEYDPRRGIVEPTDRVETLCATATAIDETIGANVRL